MSNKQFTTIGVATLAALAAFAVSVDTASAKSRSHISIGSHSGHHDGNHRRHHSWDSYRAPVYVSEPYVRSCYFVRRSGALYKVCPVY
jgi:hypothetical protein